MKPFPAPALLSATLLAASSAAPASAEVYALGDFAGEISNADAGFASSWKTAPTMRLDKERAALVGSGWARRDMLRPVDFAADGEHFLRFTVTRNNTTRAAPSE